MIVGAAGPYLASPAPTEQRVRGRERRRQYGGGGSLGWGGKATGARVCVARRGGVDDKEPKSQKRGGVLLWEREHRDAEAQRHREGEGNWVRLEIWHTWHGG